ncbi:hypothetical protein MC885_008123 [Smutsia gigantea]|nr:hypothetical protein MC885_008123 [Smutsia gigantea]
MNIERPLLYFPSSIAEAELAILCGGAGGRGGIYLSLAPAAASGVRVRGRRRLRRDLLLVETFLECHRRAQNLPVAAF